MGTKVDQLKSLLEDMNYLGMIEVSDSLWMEEDGLFYWNTDNNKEDLLNQDGNTYSGEQVEGGIKWDGYLVVNIDTQQGYWVTYLFDLDKQVDPDTE